VVNLYWSDNGREVVFMRLILYLHTYIFWVFRHIDVNDRGISRQQIYCVYNLSNKNIDAGDVSYYYIASGLTVSRSSLFRGRAQLSAYTLI